MKRRKKCLSCYFEIVLVKKTIKTTDPVGRYFTSIGPKPRLIDPSEITKVLGVNYMITKDEKEFNKIRKCPHCGTRLIYN